MIETLRLCTCLIIKRTYAAGFDRKIKELIIPSEGDPAVFMFSEEFLKF